MSPSCSAGIGAEVAKALASLGADVYLTARDTVKGQAVVDEIQRSQSAQGKVQLLHLELGSLQSVRDCAAAFLKRSQELTLLVCNAGERSSPATGRALEPAGS